MKFILVGILAAFICATATAERNFHETLMLVPYVEVEKNIKRYLSNIKCVSGVVDEVLANDESKVWWDELKASVIRQVNVDMKVCMEITDEAEEFKCKTKLIQVGIETAFSVPKKFTGSISWELAKTIRNKLTWKCFDVKALIMLLNQFRQLGVIEVLPEISTEYAHMFGEASKRNGNEIEWAKTESILMPHLINWNKCSEKSNRLFIAYCHLKEGTSSARIMADHVLSIGESNAPMLVELIDEVHKKWCLPLTPQ